MIDSVLSSPATSRRSAVARAIVAACGGSAAVCVVIIVLTLVRQRPLPVLTALFVPWLLTVFAAMVAFAIWTASRPRPDDLPRGVSLSTRPVRLWGRSPLAELSNGRKAAVLAVVACGMVAFVSTIPALRFGWPAAPTESCQYRLSSKANETCVLRADYERAQLAQQRLMASIDLMLFAGFGGAALAELRPRSRRRDGTPPMPDIDPGPDVYTILRDRPTG
jgi:hypothetical protein